MNLFLPGDIDKWDLHMLHWMAWERGMKSLYYLRSKSIARASFAGSDSSSSPVRLMCFIPIPRISSSLLVTKVPSPRFRMRPGCCCC